MLGGCELKRGMIREGQCRSRRGKGQKYEAGAPSLEARIRELKATVMGIVKIGPEFGVETSARIALLSRQAVRS